MSKFNRIPRGISASAPVDKIARAVVKERVRAAEYYWKRVAKRDVPRVKDIHQLRVWSRRAIAALDLFANQLPTEPAAELRRKLNKARKRVGNARDCDVLLASLDKHERELLQDALPRLNDRRREAAQRLRKSYRKKVKSGALEELLRAAQKKQTSKAPDAVRHNGKVRSLPTFGPWFKEQLQVVAADFLAQLKATKPGERKIHPLRIAGKQVRYVLEIGLPSLSKTAGKALYAALEDLQEHLGAICDHQALAEQYRDLAQDLKAKERPPLMQAAGKHTRAGHACWTKFIRWWQGAAGRKKLLRLLAALNTPAPAQRRKIHEK
jgi:CHAD domain-containing protein